MSRLELVVAGAEKALKTANVSAQLLAEVLPANFSKLSLSLRNQAPPVVQAGEQIATNTIAWTRRPQQFSEILGSTNWGKRIEASPVAPKVGDLVGVPLGKEGLVSGELVKWHRTIDGDMLAVMQLRNGNLVSKAPGEGLNQISPNLWADKSGAVFRTKSRFSPDEIPSSTELDFVPNMFAPARSRVNQFYMPTGPSTSKLTNDLIASSYRNPDAFLFALHSAPQKAFDPKLLVGQRTPFNPEALNSNCMSCTASVLQTLRTGRLTTAKDIENAGIGAPTVGRFKNQNEALDWFSQAAGVRIVNAINDVDKIALGRPYAAQLGLASTRADASHMVFAYRQKSLAPLIYDGQSNIRFIPESLVTSRVPKMFYELEHIGQKSKKVL